MVRFAKNAANMHSQTLNNLIKADGVLRINRDNKWPIKEIREKS